MGKERDTTAADFDISLLDCPEVSRYIFYPRQDPLPQDDITLYPVEVEQRSEEHTSELQSLS